MSRFVAGCLCALLLSPLPVNAQVAEPGTIGARKQTSAVRIANDLIRIDGHLDEPAWREGPMIEDFVQKEPIEGVAATEPMQVRFRYDTEALYVGARMFKEPDAQIQAPQGRRDRGEQAE